MDEFRTLINVQDLQALLSAGANCFLFDCRFSLGDDDYGRKAYEAGHLPGARYADLNRHLSAPAVPGITGRHPLPDREDFVRQVRQWGVDNESQIIAYDDNAGAFAARLWWMFRWLGHDRCAVLDGGLDAWKAAGYPVVNELPETPVSSFEARSPLTRTVSAAQITEQAGLLTDAREPARFRGETEPVDRIAGHIPGAVCLPFTGNLDSGQFRSRPELQRRFTEAGIDRDTRVTCYCGSGVTATHNILALKHAGFPEAALYPGSWSEWITDPGRPVATGD